MSVVFEALVLIEHGCKFALVGCDGDILEASDNAGHESARRRSIDLGTFAIDRLGGGDRDRERCSWKWESWNVRLTRCALVCVRRRAETACHAYAARATVTAGGGRAEGHTAAGAVDSSGADRHGRNWG